MKRYRIKPYSITDLPLHQVRVETTSLGDGDLQSEYGFGTGSMQQNLFLRPPPNGSRNVAFALHSGETPETLDSHSVVARMFGRVRGRDLEIWHLSVRKSHPLNDGLRGERWGVYGLRLDSVPTKARWYTADGLKLTRSNSDALVRGSPNPNAVQLLYKVMKRLGCDVARQHESSPCAQLFDSGYTHTTHPATLLIYRTLGFERLGGLDAYSWNYGTMIDIDLSWRRYLFRTKMGIPAIFDRKHQRRREDMEFTTLCNCSF